MQLKNADNGPKRRLRTQTRNPAVRTFPDGKAQVVVDKLRPVSFGGSGWPVMMSEPQQTCRLGLHFCAMTVGVGIMISSQSVAAQPALAVVPHLQLASVSTQASGFEAYKRYLMQRARSEGVTARTIQAYVPSLGLNMRAIELDRAQRPGGVVSGRSPPLRPYLRRHITSSLIRRGQNRYSSLWPQLRRIQAIYGVDPATLLAIYGKETSFGSVTGNFDLLEALASLAYEGRRRQMFETEFVATLKLLDSGIARRTLRGSYAGATGLPQFMPSVALRLRVDGDGDGRANIWTSEVDALASIANYLRDAGWKPGVPWGSASHVPTSLNRSLIRSHSDEPQCRTALRRHSRRLSITQWRELGVRARSSIRNGEEATLLEPEGLAETPYLLTSNYRAILRYNCSNFYGMSVALLSDAIARR